MFHMYTDTLIYAVDVKNKLNLLATKNFDDQGCSYCEEIRVRDNYYKVSSSFDKDDMVSEGDKIDIPDILDWADLITGKSNATVENLLNISGLSPKDVAAVITIKITSLEKNPFSYRTEILRPDGAHIHDGFVSALFPKHNTAKISTQKIVQALIREYYHNFKQFN